MKRRIIVLSVDMGVYEGDDEDEIIDKFATDVGYPSGEKLKEEKGKPKMIDPNVDV